MSDIVIVAAARTAVGKFGGTLSKTPAADLGAAVIADLLRRTKLTGDQISEAILGQVLTAGVGQNPARQAVLKAGLPHSVSALTINKVCGSGLKAVMLAAQSLRDGDSEIVIAGGQENMSLSPHVLAGSREGQRMGDWKMIDSMIVDGLWDVYNQYHMGITAENVAKKYAVSREDQDALALSSQQKAAAAQDAGKFKDEIVPFSIGRPSNWASSPWLALPATLLPASTPPTWAWALCLQLARPWSAPVGKPPIWTCSKSMKPSPPKPVLSTRKWAGTPRRSTSMAARSPSATRSVRLAAGFLSRCCMKCNVVMRRRALRPCALVAVWALP